MFTVVNNQARALSPSTMPPQIDDIRMLLRHPNTIQAAQLPPSAAALTMLPFPNEILLHCFSFMTLRALIACRCVCATWRSLVPLAELDPLRRRLLELYDTVINTSYFLETRPWIVAHLDSTFDREAYIATLEAQDPAIRVPPAFRLFILEWPALAAVQSLWPGLPLLDCRKSNIERKKGVNFIACTHPELSALTYKLGYPGVAFVPALLLWRNSGDSTDWLIFDDDRHPELSGKVFGITLRLDPDIVSYCEWGEGPEDRTDYHTLVRRGNYNDFVVYRDWIEYLQRMWRNLSICTPFGPVSRDVLPQHDVLVCLEGNDDFADRTHHDIPAPPWTRRAEPRFWQRLGMPG
ncbi:hypothetical protein NLJ89_g2095 [Agrocybe chaxingu]|uniref:F-box domain-containing protein n=1 Tax=Agrocybe chaxingu TaxID=84603 RepID=A0A9W8MYY3_9AGAR|nr:hypothetical protein NLJ89_g2095 [Agrocybe chaxingu]